MKKTVFAIFLLVCLSCASISFAMTISMDAAGVSVELPPDSRVEALSDGSKICTFQAYVKDYDDNVFVYLFGCIDELEGRGIHDLSDEEMGNITIALTEDMGVGADDLEMERTELNDIPYALIRNSQGSLLLYYTIQNGWVYVVGTARLSGTEVTDDDLRLLGELTTGVVFH